MKISFRNICFREIYLQRPLAMVLTMPKVRACVCGSYDFSVTSKIENNQRDKKKIISFQQFEYS